MGFRINAVPCQANSRRKFLCNFVDASVVLRLPPLITPFYIILHHIPHITSIVPILG
jgi:hypothetical protein